LAVGFGILVAVPLAVLAFQARALRSPIIVVSTVVATVPSIAAFVFLVPYTGLARATAVIPLALYTWIILVRNTLVGLDNVSADVVESATGLGYPPWRRLLRIQLPLATPAILAGVRIATVTTIGLIPVAAIVGQGGLGALMTDGFQRDFLTPLTVGVVLAILLAVVADVVLLGVLRLATPWTRASVR
jgi:osmoprotectant transport system permease protein